MQGFSRAARGRAMVLLLACSCSVDGRSVRTEMGTSGLGAEAQPEGGTESVDDGAGSNAGAEPSAGTQTSAEPSTASTAPPGAAGSGQPDTSGMASGGAAGMSAGRAMFSAGWVGDGRGTLSVEVEGERTYDCPQPCAVQVTPGSLVRVTARPEPYTVVRSWSEPSCGAQPSCSLTAQADRELRVEFQLQYQVAFATNRTWLPSELPRAGEAANNECTYLAKAAGFHGDRWVAWLSTSNGTPETGDDVHAIDQFQHTGGWLRPDGMPIARSLAALTRGELLAPILLASRVQQGHFAAWSNTSREGRSFDTALDCNGWTSDDDASLAHVAWGSAMAGPTWDGGNVESCGEAMGLICLGDDSDDEVELSPAAGRLVFLSEATFAPGGGVAAADELCQREACAAGLTGSGDCEQALGSERTFLSYLHTSTRRAWERFDLSGPTWVRPDGMAWLASAADLARDAADALVPAAVLLGPRYGLGPGAMWVGEAAGTSTCGDWTSSSGSGAISSYALTSSAGLGNFLLPNGFVYVSECSGAMALLCLEQ